MIVLSCDKISKSFGTDNILEDITFSINENEKIGLIGLNGAGKSTLFNILSKESSPDSGNVYTSKNSKLGFLKQALDFPENATIFEQLSKVFSNLISMEKDISDLELFISKEGEKGESAILTKAMDSYSTLIEKFNEANGYGYKSEIFGVLRGLGFPEESFHKKISDLSGGQKARISLGKILLEKPDILLLDEPTNHLDINAITWLEKYIKEYSGTVILISHDRYFLDNTINKVFLLENKSLNIYSGNYSVFVKKRKKDLEVLQKQFNSQKKEIERQEAIIKKYLSYNTERYVGLARSRRKLLDKMKKLDDPTVFSNKAKIRFTPSKQSGNDILTVKDLSMSYDSKKIFKNINFNVYKGECIGLIGENGVGKTSLLKIIQSIEIPSSGTISLGHNVNIGYFDQEQSTFSENKTIIDEVWDEYPKLAHSEIRTLLARFLFYGDDIFKEISTLSGGEKSRLSILKLMLSNSNFLLMDEPTNHLDLDSKEILEDALMDYEGTVLVISHDRYFLNRVTDKIMYMSSESIDEYHGNYDYYLEKITKLLQDKKEIEDKQKNDEKLEKKKLNGKSQNKNQKTKINTLEKEIEKLELDISTLELKLCSPEIYNNYEISLETNKELEYKKEKANQLYDELLALT